MRLTIALFSFATLASPALAASNNEDAFMVLSCHVADNSATVPAVSNKLFRVQFAFSQPKSDGKLPAYFRIDDPNKLFEMRAPEAFFLDRAVIINGKPALHGVFISPNARARFDFVANASTMAMQEKTENVATTFSMITREDNGPESNKLAYGGDCAISLWSSQQAADEMFARMAALPNFETVAAEKVQ